MILVDTGPLVALCDPRDRLHGAALADLERLSRQTFVTCAPVLSECCFHLPHAAQRERLRRFLVAFSVGDHAPDDELGLRNDIFDWLARYAEHRPDWADAHLAVLSGRERRYRVWTYDRAFRTIWRRPNGSRIPLAVRG
jgi:predicted nucleic acid-binding protein